MQNKKIFLVVAFCFIFLFSVNLAWAQTCGESDIPGAERGQCSSKCDLATEHEITGTCIGQVCCAANPANSSGGSEGLSCSEDADGVCLLPSECDQSLSQSYYDCEQGEVCCIAQGNGGSGGGGTGSGATGGGAGLPVAPGSGGTTAPGGWSLGNISGFGLPSSSIWRILTNILVWMLGLFGIIGIIGFLISGILYLTAAGDEDQMAYAKRAMQYSIIGVIVGLVGFVIIQAIDYALNGYSSF
jgi:hypothetical protein